MGQLRIRTQHTGIWEHHTLRQECTSYACCACTAGKGWVVGKGWMPGLEHLVHVAKHKLCSRQRSLLWVGCSWRSVEPPLIELPLRVLSLPVPGFPVEDVCPLQVLSNHMQDNLARRVISIADSTVDPDR
eukprot:3941613-Rhodomonas_salina.9